MLAEVDYQPDHSAAWTEQITALAHRLRTVLEDHPGVAGLLQTRDPLGPHSLALTEAFLAPLHAAGLSAQHAGLAFCLLSDYILGFAVSTPTSINEQRVRDAATRRQLHTFFRSLPADQSHPAVADHVWTDNRDERFTAGLDPIRNGLPPPDPRTVRPALPSRQRPEPRQSITQPPRRTEQPPSHDNG